MTGMRAVRKFIRDGVYGLIAEFIELGLTVAWAAARCSEVAQAQRHYRAHRPEHLADRMDRAHREARLRTWPPS